MDDQQIPLFERVVDKNPPQMETNTAPKTGDTLRFGFGGFGHSSIGIGIIRGADGGGL
jgi:hypothetical protein